MSKISYLIKTFKEGFGIMSNDSTTDSQNRAVKLCDEYSYTCMDYKDCKFLRYAVNDSMTIDEVVDIMCRDDNSQERRIKVLDYIHEHIPVEDGRVKVQACIDVMVYHFHGKDFYLTITGESDDKEFHSFSENVISIYQNDHPEMTFEEARNTFFTHLRIDLGFWNMSGELATESNNFFELAFHMISIPLENEEYDKVVISEKLHNNFIVHPSMCD